MPPFQDLTGKQFGRLTVLRCAAKSGNSPLHVTLWYCQCTCGNTATVRVSQLIGRRTKSCGCLSKDTTTARSFKHGHSHRDGWSHEYYSWTSAKARCHRPNAKHYGDYGGRGITMCEEWRSDFAAFLRDIGPCPPGYTLERINVNGNYEPGNTKWIPAQLQARNKRTTRRLTLNGETLPLTEWAERLGISAHTLHGRLRYGWPVDRVLTTGLMDAAAKAQPRGYRGRYLKTRV